MSPYRIPDSTEPAPENGAPVSDAPTPEELEAEGVPELREAIASLRPAVLAEVAEAEGEAAQEVASTPEAEALGAAGWVVASAWLEYRRRADAIRADTTRTLEGKAAMMEEAAAARDERIQRVASSVLSGVGDTLEARFPFTGLATPPADLSAACALALQRGHVGTPAAHLRETADTLRMAVSHATPPQARYNANVMLAFGFLPLLQRRASAPERFAQPFQPLAAELLRLVEGHLGAVTKRAAHEEAARLVRDARGSFSWLAATCAEHGGWDATTAQLGAGNILQEPA